MTKQEAYALLDGLTYEEKLILYRLLVSLRERRKTE